MKAVALIFMLFTASALAQLRTIPADAKRAKMRHVQERVVELDGKRAMLAPGAQIRDASNRVIVPSALPPDSVIKYRRDSRGAVREVWILTPQEANK